MYEVEATGEVEATVWDLLDEVGGWVCVIGVWGFRGRG